MGTRAQFFIGNPVNVHDREWLGCTALDGYPTGYMRGIQYCVEENHFREFINNLKKTRDDFCDPAKHGFPFPWVNNLFLTDCTYALFDGKVMFACADRGWFKLREYLLFSNQSDEEFDTYYKSVGRLPNTLAPTTTWDRSGPDSIMILRG